MALQQLSDEQIRTWTPIQKDRWWLEHVYRGSMPQLTLRSGLAGFALGGLLGATALYIGAKTGINIGVGLTSVILAFVLFRALSAAGLSRDCTILENNCTQSIATAAGYVVGPLFSSLAAYMLVTGVVVPWWQLMVWMVVVSMIGVLLAFPMKRRFINREQLPFPEGRACGVVLDSLYNGASAPGQAHSAAGGDAGMAQARLLGVSAAVGAGWQLLISDGWMKLIQFKLLALDRWAALKDVWVLHERLDEYYYAWAMKTQAWMPQILGTDVRVLGLRLTLDMAMIGVGGLIGMTVATSCLLGAFINFAVLAPLMIQAGDIAPRLGAAGQPLPLNRAEIVNQWSMWWGVSMMVAGSITSLLIKPELFTGLFRRPGGGTAEPASVPQAAPAVGGSGPHADPLRHIEVPLWISWVGVPVFSLLGAWITNQFFGVPLWLALVSLPLIFVLTVICTNSMALTSWTPTGALSKITQFSMGAIDRANPASNLMPAAMTAEIAANAANLLSDIKPGYMLGGKPRHQAVGHVIGLFAGTLCCVPLFFLLFLPPDANGVRQTSTLISEAFAMPAALQWKGVTEIIAGGFKGLPASALWAMGVAAVAAVAIEVLRVLTGGRFALSAVSIGLGVVLPPEATLCMWFGALLFWVLGRRHAEPGTAGHRRWVQGAEPICAGLITGAALMGIGNAVVNVLMSP